MITPRLEKLLAILKSSPNDCFTLYGIALEYVANEPILAEKYFKQTLSVDEGFLATYYMLGKLLESQERFEEAKTVFEKGIAIAQQQNEHKTLAELRTALQNLILENDL